jgi:hypothetical protein
MEPGMLSKNLNKEGWQSRLEDPAELAGETCKDKNALWQKLGGRLNEKPRRIRVVWYWAAAACLLFAPFFPFIKGNRIVTDTVKTTIVKKQPATNNLSVTVPSLKKESIEQRKAVIEKKQPKNKFMLQVNQQTVLKDITTGKEVAIKKLPGNPAQQQPVVIVDPVAVTPAIPVFIAIRTPILKQKLKVVHNNELGGITEYNHANEHIAEHHTIRIEFMSQGIFTSIAPSSTETDYKIFKIKTSPSN